MSNQETLDYPEKSQILPSLLSENYILTYNAFFSLPIRMPGITVSVYCTTPTFQLTLKGGCDESSIFEMNQVNYHWKITPMNFALGRLVYDIVWEEGLTQDAIISLRVLYATIIKSTTTVMTQSIESRTWCLDINPRNWIMLPKSRNQVLKIYVQLCLSTIQSTKKSTKFEQQDETVIDSIQKQSELISEIHCPKYRLAIATIPLKIIDDVSSNGVLDFAVIHNSSLMNHKLNFSQIYGAWLVFEQSIDWEKYKVKVTYSCEK